MLSTLHMVCSAIIHSSADRKERTMAYGVQEIEQTRDLFMKKGFRKESLEIDGFQLPYYVIPRTWAAENKPDVPAFFAFRMTPAPALMGTGKMSIAQETLFGVSDTIRELWRPHVARHEMREYVALVLDHRDQYDRETETIPNGCLVSSEAEWQDVLDGLDPRACIAYANMRRTFFQGVVAYALAHPDDYSASSVGNFRQSLNFWAEKTL